MSSGSLPKMSKHNHCCSSLQFYKQNVPACSYAFSPSSRDHRNRLPVKWLAILFHLPENPISNLGRQIRYAYWDSLHFTSEPQILERYPKSVLAPFLPHHFELFFQNDFNIWCYICTTGCTNSPQISQLTLWSRLSPSPLLRHSAFPQSVTALHTSYFVRRYCTIHTMGCRV
jgi:hypothetical protein